MPRRSRRLVLSAAVPAVLVGLAGCGTATVTADDVATAAEDTLEEQVGARPDVTCPDDLEAKVGATARCTLTADGLDGEYGVTVTVTKVEGDTASFDVQVDQQPQG
ncbi:DUF4333 domain-containing protein [Geodermatophilus sp. URMC 64]